MKGSDEGHVTASGLTPFVAPVPGTIVRYFITFDSVGNSGYIFKKGK